MSEIEKELPFTEPPVIELCNVCGFSVCSHEQPDRHEKAAAGRSLETDLALLEEHVSLVRQMIETVYDEMTAGRVSPHAAAELFAALKQPIAESRAFLDLGEIEARRKAEEEKAANKLVKSFR